MKKEFENDFNEIAADMTEADNNFDAGVNDENADDKINNGGIDVDGQEDGRFVRRPREKSGAHLYLEGILERMNLQVRVDEKFADDALCFYIAGENASGAIGHRGETLDAIQYLVSVYVNKEKGEGDHIRVTVDADFYREKRKRTLAGLAKRLAKEALRTRREIALEPMNSYERRIIHSTLQDSEEAYTRSEGEGKERHIVITPKVEEILYGDSGFKKAGPSKTRSFGYKKRKF